MAPYRLRALARDDLEAIWDYTVGQWGIKQAERYLDILFSCFDDLAANPQLGRPRDAFGPHGNPVYRFDNPIAGSRIRVRIRRNAALKGFINTKGRFALTTHPLSAPGDPSGG